MDQTAALVEFGSLKEPYYDSVELHRLRLFRDATGRLRLSVEGDRSFLEVKVVCAFPLSQPDGYLGFLDGRRRDMVICIVEDPGRLDAASRQEALAALHRHYFVPLITRVHGLKEEFGATYFDVDTDRGRRQFVCRGVRDGLEELADGDVIIPDVDGNRFRVRDWEHLDARSRRLLERVV